MKKQLLKLSLLVFLTPLAVHAQTTPSTQAARPDQATLDEYYLAKSSSRGDLEAHTAARAYIIKYHGTQATEDSLYRVLRNYAEESERIFDTYKGEEMQVKLAALVLKTDSLKQKFLGVLTTATLATNSKFSDALRYEKALQLTPAQVTQLKAEAVKLDEQKRDFHAKNPDKSFDAKPAEAKMATILSEEQYHSYLLSKNKDQAVKWANGDWADMKARGLANPADSAKVIFAIMTYDMRKLAAREQYADDGAKLSINLAEIERSIPEELKTLRYTIAHGNPVKADVAKSSFTW